jgi:hypothetical protein
MLLGAIAYSLSAWAAPGLRLPKLRRGYQALLITLGILLFIPLTVYLISMALPQSRDLIKAQDALTCPAISIPAEVRENLMEEGKEHADAEVQARADCNSLAAG